MTLLDAGPVPAVATAASAAFAPAGLRALRAAVRGWVLTAADAGHETSRHGHNLVFDRHPAVIVRPADATDGSRAVLTARELGLEIAVKGGHSVAGHSVNDGGMVIDLADMRGIEIDPIHRVGSAQGGVTAGEYTTGEDPARLHAAYPGATYERLVAVKRRVDPENLFHGNHNIRPS